MKNMHKTFLDIGIFLFFFPMVVTAGVKLFIRLGFLKSGTSPDYQLKYEEDTGQGIQD